jgi:hypothetical protein
MPAATIATLVIAQNKATVVEPGLWFSVDLYDANNNYLFTASFEEDYEASVYYYYEVKAEGLSPFWFVH